MLGETVLQILYGVVPHAGLPPGCEAAAMTQIRLGGEHAIERERSMAKLDRRIMPAEVPTGTGRPAVPGSVPKRWRAHRTLVLEEPGASARRDSIRMRPATLRVVGHESERPRFTRPQGFGRSADLDASWLRITGFGRSFVYKSG